MTWLDYVIMRTKFLFFVNFVFDSHNIKTLYSLTLSHIFLFLQTQNSTLAHSSPKLQYVSLFKVSIKLSLYFIINFTDLYCLPVLLLLAEHFAERHFAERHFVERTV